MRSIPRPLYALAAVLLAGCAQPPERLERDAAIQKAVEPCLKQHPSVQVRSIDRYGQVEFTTELRDLDGFRKCVEDGLAPLKLKSASAGRLAAEATRTRVDLQARGDKLLVPVRVNDVPALLLLDPEAAYTFIHPKLAQRAGLQPVWETRRVPITLAGSQRLVPLVQARSLRIENLNVEAIDVAVYDAPPKLEGADGILGGNFLSHFSLTIDREQRALVLVPARPSPTKPFQ